MMIFQNLLSMQKHLGKDCVLCVYLVSGLRMWKKRKLAKFQEHSRNTSSYKTK